MAYLAGLPQVSRQSYFLAVELAYAVYRNNGCQSSGTIAKCFVESSAASVHMYIFCALFL